MNIENFNKLRPHYIDNFKKKSKVDFHLKFLSNYFSDFYIVNIEGKRKKLPLNTFTRSK